MCRIICKSRFAERNSNSFEKKSKLCKSARRRPGCKFCRAGRPLAAIPTSNAAAQVRRNWADITEQVNPGAVEGFTLVQGRKRRRGSGNSPTTAAPSSNAGASRTIRRPQSSAGSVPRAQEIRATRAHIADARARQASSSEEHCVYIEHSPELEPFHYLRALDRKLGGTAGVIQITKVNGHQLLGLTNRGLAERLISEGLEVEGTLLRAFPFRKRAERITVGNLPFFVADSAVITALSPFGRVTSIAPKQMKAGPYVYVDGRRDVFITLHEGITIERLPTRLDINIKGQAWPAYLSSGIRCSRCHGQGHRRAICPLLAGLANNTRMAPPTTPAGVPPPTTSAPPQRSAAQPPAPAPSNLAMEVCSAPPMARAVLHPSAPRSSPPAAPALPMEETPSAPPPVIPAPSLQVPKNPVDPRSATPRHPEPTPPARPDFAAPRGPPPIQETLGPAAPTQDVEMSIVEETTASSASSTRNATRVDLDAFIEVHPSVSFAETDALGLGREEVLDLLSSRTKAQRKGPLLSPPQCDALAGLIGQILDLKPGHTSNLYKVLGQVRAELTKTPAAAPTPPLPAPRPAETAPPAPQGEESAPAEVAYPPPLPVKMTDEARERWLLDLFKELNYRTFLIPLLSWTRPEQIIRAALHSGEERNDILGAHPNQRSILANFLGSVIERARGDDQSALDQLSDFRREEVLDLLSSRTKAQRKGPLLSPPQCDALVSLIGQILDLKPGHTSNLYKVLGQVKAELRTTPAVPPTPPLPAPWPAKPMLPTTHREELTPPLMTPPPPAPTDMEEDDPMTERERDTPPPPTPRLAETTPPIPHGDKTSPNIATPPPPLSCQFIDDRWTEADDILHELNQERDWGVGISESDITEAVIYPEDREPLIRHLSTRRRSLLAGFISAAIERARDADPFINSSMNSKENENYVNPPAGSQDANSAAPVDLAAIPTANAAAQVRRNWADITEEVNPGAEEGFTLVQGRKRRRGSANSPTAAAPSSNAGGSRTIRRPQPSAGSVPRAQEIRVTRAHIAEARARQASSSEEHCVYIEHSPELEPFHYLRALDRMLGGTAGVIQITKVNGHQLLGLTNRGLAERLISEGLEVEGTLLRAFPFRKRAERITVGNLPFFIGDSAVINALSPYGRVTSIAPKQMKAGPYVYVDGRRDVFITLHEGITIERLPTRLDINIKGEAWPAYLSSGIRCSRCHGQGHRRAICPLLAGLANNTRMAPPTTPAGVPPPTTPAPPQRSAAQPPAPTPSNPGMEVCGATPVVRAALHSSAPRPSPTAAPAFPMKETPPAPPPVTPAPSLRTPGSREPAAPTPDVEMSIVEETFASSTSSAKKRNESRPRCVHRGAPQRYQTMVGSDSLYCKYTTCLHSAVRPRVARAPECFASGGRGVSRMATGFIRAGAPSGAEQGPVRHGSLAQPCAELSANQDLQNEIPIVLRKNQNYVNPPAGGLDANSAAPVDPPLAAIPTSNAAAQVRRNWAEITEEVNPGAEEEFTLVQGRKRRRGSGNSPTAATPSSNAGASRTIRRPQSSAGSVPRAQEIRATRAHIADARARQASSSEEHCVYIEHSPELEPFHYLRALDRKLGGTAGVIQITKVNGHQLLGLTNRGLAERLISEGLEVEGTLLRAFPFRKRAERITVGNLPFFVADSTVITALSPFGRVTSIAPKQMKAGPYVYVDGRRDVFITLHEGITIERLPTRLDINIKGQAWPAYLSSGIRCSRCHGQGHRRAICPLLAGLANNTRMAPPTTPAGVPPPTTSAPPQRSAAQPPAPAPSNLAMEVCSAPPMARAVLHPSAPRPSPPAAPALPMEETPSAPPPVIPAPSLQVPKNPVDPRSATPRHPEPTPPARPDFAAPRGPPPIQETLGPAAPTQDVEMSIVEETIASSTSSAKNATRVDLDAFIEGLPSVSFAKTDALGLGREEVLDLLSSRTKAQRKGPLLSPPQCDALVGLIGQILDLKPGHTSNLYKVLGQVKAELRTTPAVPPTPTLPAPWPAKPTPPALHGEKTSPDIATPPPPLSTEFIDACYDQANDIIYELSDERYLETLSDIGVTEGDIVEAIIFPDDREPLLRRLSTQKRTILAGIVSAASERARSSDPF
ncbi:hypothetical protein LAZ67_15003011, partial [Cordylochernes scorpioides]